MNEDKYKTTKIQMPELPKLEYKTLWGWHFENWEDGPEPNEDTFFAELPNSICLDLGVYGYKRRYIILRIFIDGWDWNHDDGNLFLEKICPTTLEEAADVIVKKINQYSKYPVAPEAIRIGKDAEREYIDKIWSKDWS